MKKLLSNYKGFTLVELMVVVGIIGILATIAIPNFRKYQAKSKTTEAKIQLSSVYTTQESMLLEYDTYASCLTSGGYNPSPDEANRFYGIGFGAVSTQDGVAATAGLASCTAPAATACVSGTCSANHFFYKAGKGAGGHGAAAAVADLPGTSVAAASFSAGATGRIDASLDTSAPAAALDKWYINEKKKLVHVKAGY